MAAVSRELRHMIQQVSTLNEAQSPRAHMEAVTARKQRELRAYTRLAHDKLVLRWKKENEAVHLLPAAAITAPSDAGV
jgi:hypothetical protein